MTDSAKETRQQKEQGVELNKILKKGVRNTEGLYKLGMFGRLCKLWELYISGKASLTC